ncbi:MAG: hypothetical protein AUH42_06000 [Gemmatimonadetes bacterium 13_1_40CM_70_11]|nr:MAG: hypothetical protein AUH42_06000 [Gemmatimonadetes bacterium 13_1_40CM_70_11]
MSAWTERIVAAGAVPAAFVPEGSGGRTDVDEVAGAQLVEDERVAVHAVAPGRGPVAVTFLDGIQRWTVVGYDGVVPIVRGYVAAAARRRGADRRLRTAREAARELAVAPLTLLRPGVRRALEESGAAVVDLDAAAAGQPGRMLVAAQQAVNAERVRVETEVAEDAVRSLGAEEWLVVDGLLSESARLAGHPRALGVIKSHSAQYFEGAELQTALTCPASARTSVFRPRGRARHEVYSWYLRLWPWEGNDLLFGLLRIEARAHDATVASATAVSGWLLAERAPLATPDTRFDRLLYPIHDVETYLRSRAPRDVLPPAGSRLPKTGT